MPCQEQIVRLLIVIHHENITKRFLKLNLEYKNKKKGRGIYKHIFFLSFVRLCSKSASCNWIPQLFLSCSLFQKAAIIIAILAQEMLRWQLSKVLTSGMYKSNFEAINKVVNKRMKKLKMEYGPFIYTIIPQSLLCYVYTQSQEILYYVIVTNKSSGNFCEAIVYVIEVLFHQCQAPQSVSKTQCSKLFSSKQCSKLFALFKIK